MVVEQTYAALHLLAVCQRWSIVRLRLDAAAAPNAGPEGRPWLKGARLPSLQQRLADPHTA